ncbi:MAG: hypothetical protein KF894_16375 [Labilithrix sp.]|nr:hypothetical protein [Labilithrix sp.]
MPSTTVVVACVAGLSLLVVLILLARSRRKAAETESPRFEPPRELAKRPSKAAPEPTAAAAEPPATEASAKAEPSATQTPPTPPVGTDKPELDGASAEDAERTPPSEEVVVDSVAEEAPTANAAPAAPPPLPRAGSRPGTPRPPMPSYSSINDESVAEEVRRESMTPAPAATAADDGPAVAAVGDTTAAAPAGDTTAAAPAPAVAAASTAAPPAPAVAAASTAAPPAPAVAAASAALPPPANKPPASAPKTPAAGAEGARAVSEARLTTAKRAAVSEPRVATAPTSEAKAPAAKPLPTSQAKLGAAKPAVSEPRLAPAADEHDFSALNDEIAGKPKVAAATSAAATAAKFAPPPNPATADLEKNDPRHAAARRLARVSVSEIKLYHEDEVKAGREAKDLWKRLQQDIGLAKQTFEGRVVPEVRERFDYLLDEIVRQLAEGDASKLGPDAPQPKGESTQVAPPAPTSPPPANAPAAAGSLVDPEAPTRTLHKTLEPTDASAPAAPAAAAPSTRTAAAAAPTASPSTRTAAAPAASPSTRTAAATPASPSTRTAAATPASPSTRTAAATASSAAAPAAPSASPAEAGKPSGIAARGLPPNPETAELEKSDPRHAAARRLARLSVSEIKLYHEDEVKAGREAKDLWKRMIADIGLATQTYEKRVDKEVRARFDYLYDEIVRQLAEGDVAKLGPDAPKPKAAPAEAVAPAPEALTPAAAAPAVDEPKPAPAAGPAARYAPPSNPATAELEKSDPRHAAARRLARLSVSEIKLYHEDEVKAGREAKDLWKRLTTDIGLATQTYEKRVDKEVRDRFDYLYDEILRQLAEGDSAKLGPDAPKPKTDA